MTILLTLASLYLNLNLLGPNELAGASTTAETTTPAGAFAEVSTSTSRCPDPFGNPAPCPTSTTATTQPPRTTTSGCFTPAGVPSPCPSTTQPGNTTTTGCATTSGAPCPSTTTSVTTSSICIGACGDPGRPRSPGSTVPSGFEPPIEVSGRGSQKIGGGDPDGAGRKRFPAAVGDPDQVSLVPTGGARTGGGSMARAGAYRLPGSEDPEVPAPTAGGGAVLPLSSPTRIQIPAIGVVSEIMALGLSADGELAVPAPGPHYDDAAWYRHSPTPGSLGPAVISGHRDSATSGPSIFYRLSELRRGDRILVARADGTVAVFSVDGMRQYPKDHFPTRTVYGDTDRAALRLVTCSGPFDRSSGRYLDNLVVFASLIGPTAAPPR